MQQIFDIYKDHPAASETVDRDNDHHPVLLEVGRFYGTDDLSEQFADSSSTTDYGAMFAMSALSLIPVFLIFLFFNKYLVEGISSSGLKG